MSSKKNLKDTTVVCTNLEMEYISSPSLLVPGKVARFQAWTLKRLVSVFNRVASRGHYPRERAIQRIYIGSGIPLPADPRYLLQMVS